MFAHLLRLVAPQELVHCLLSRQGVYRMVFFPATRPMMLMVFFVREGIMVETWVPWWSHFHQTNGRMLPSGVEPTR